MNDSFMKKSITGIFNDLIVKKKYQSFYSAHQREKSALKTKNKANQIRQVGMLRIAVTT